MDLNVNLRKMKLMVFSVINSKVPDILYFWQIWYQLGHLQVQSSIHELSLEEHREKMSNFPNKEKICYCKGKLQGFINNNWEKEPRKDTQKLLKLLEFQEWIRDLSSALEQPCSHNKY
jgi:hypothetical protein